MRVNSSHFAANCVTRASHEVELDRIRAEAARVVDGDGCLSVTYYWPSPGDMVATKEGDGGAISFENGAQVSLENASFRNNKATNGGAIAMLGNESGLTVAASSFSRNIAKVDGGALKTESGMIHISNTTFSNNRASHGGVAVLESGEIAMTHVTMKDNRAEWKGGAIVNWGGVVKLRNSIIDSLSRDDDCIGALNQIVGTLSRDETCGNFRSDDLLLGDLTDEPAWHPLGDGSPAIDAGLTRPIARKPTSGAWRVLMAAAATSGRLKRRPRRPRFRMSHLYARLVNRSSPPIPTRPLAPARPAMVPTPST